LTDYITTDARICGSCGSAIDVRDAMRPPVPASERTLDEYPIRHSWTFVVPPPPPELAVTSSER
jgi:hypothetical protein